MSIILKCRDTVKLTSSLEWCNLWVEATHAFWKKTDSISFLQNLESICSCTGYLRIRTYLVKIIHCLTVINLNIWRIFPTPQGDCTGGLD